MNNRTLSAFALASVLALASTPGHALSFDFSFSNFNGNIAGTVTGVIEGLTDNATSSATDVIVESYPSALSGLPAVPFTLTQSSSASNTFTVANGLITHASFFDTGRVLCLSLATSFCAGGAFLASGFNDVVGPPSYTATPGPVVGAGLPGLIFAGAGLLGWWRRKRKLISAGAWT